MVPNSGRPRSGYRGHVRGAVLSAVTLAQSASSSRCGPIRIGSPIPSTCATHAFEHRLAVVFYQDGDAPLPDETDHRFGIVLENDGFLQMQMLERGGHAHAKADRAVFEQIESHDTDSASCALRGLRGGALWTFAGKQTSARPPQ